ncbi:caspase domain-containing protein [Daedaleopsis nitida]|nr:caspase domain-containing protein [Daedaleopsis nitida]
MVKIGPRFHPRRRSTPRAPPPKLALLIGIDYVDAPQDGDYPPLRRARSDTKDFRQLLITKYEYRPENVVTMLDGEGTPEELQPTRENILREIRSLVSGAREGSRFVFFFSGHSGQVPSPNTDEDDGLDEYLVPVDHSQHDGSGDVKKRMILDNKLRKLLVDPLPVGAYLTAIFDSCHSGTLLDLDHYLCNNVYYPWTNIGGVRRYMTKWLGVRRKDGQLSQSGVKVITKKHANKGKDKADGRSASGPSRENSACSVRIYQRRRVSENEMQVIDHAVGVTNSEDGKHRQFSVQSRRRTSVQCKPSLSLAQVVEGAQSMDSLDEGGEGFGPRCASPTSIKTCTGFCDPDDAPIEGGTVMSISSCQDSQRTWESKKGSFTQWLIELLRLDPHQPIGKFLQAITYKMYDHAQHTHQYSIRMKDRYRQTHPLEGTGSTGSSASANAGTSASVTTMGASTDTAASLTESDSGRQSPTHPLDKLEFIEIPEPQVRAIDIHY